MANDKKQIDVRSITRISTVVVALLSLAIVAATGWFIVGALNAVTDTSRSSGLTDKPAVETVNTVLLETLHATLETKTAAPDAVTPGLKNPFLPKIAPTQPAPETPPAGEQPGQ